jgi:hypothetical protein
MDSDIKENYARIIESKLKLLKAQADKYESLISEEVKKVIAIQKEIEEYKQTKVSEESKLENETIFFIEQKYIALNTAKDNLSKLRKEKKDALGSDMKIGFSDDLKVKYSYEQD